MRAIPRWAVVALTLLIPVGPNVPAGEPTVHDDAETFFELKVRPVLAGTCVKCHGPAKASGGLRLDSREAMLKGGESGPPVVPGDPRKSLLIQAIEHEDDSLTMPPEKLLPTKIRGDLASWVKSGAAWPQTALKPGDSVEIVRARQGG